MNKTQALKEAVKRWGKDAMIRDDKKNASTPEQREAARAKRMHLRATLTKEELRARKPEMDALLHEALKQRYSVGYHGGFYFGIRGTGDTWEECFASSDRALGKAA